MLKAIIFDMDGVLINSPKYTKLANDALFKELGVVIPSRSGNGVIRGLGISLRDRLATWQKETPYCT